MFSVALAMAAEEAECVSTIVQNDFIGGVDFFEPIKQSGEFVVWGVYRNFSLTCLLRARHGSDQGHHYGRAGGGPGGADRKVWLEGHCNAQPRAPAGQQAAPTLGTHTLPQRHPQSHSCTQVRFVQCGVVEMVAFHFLTKHNPRSRLVFRVSSSTTTRSAAAACFPHKTRFT